MPTRDEGPERPITNDLRVVGLLALPLSLLPFVAYCTLTPEGRLVRDKVVAWVAPPDLPRLSDAQQREAAAIVPPTPDGSRPSCTTASGRVPTRRAATS